MKNLSTGDGVSEVCTCLGQYYENCTNYPEAVLWYYNAAYETTSILSLDYGHRLPLEGLIRCYESLGDLESARHYESELNRL